MPDAGYNMDGFGAGYVTPDGRRAEIHSRLQHDMNGPYVDPSLMSDEEIADALERHYQENSSAWANQGEFAEARKAYALDVPDTASSHEIMRRWSDSRNLLDPETRKNKQYDADAQLLRALAAVQNSKPTPPSNGLDALGYDNQLRGQYATEQKLQGLVDNYDAEVASPLVHSSRRGIMQTLVDPETNVGWYMGKANTAPEAHKMYLGGESDTWYDAFGNAIGNDTANRATRWMTETPVLDLNPESSVSERRAALDEMRARQSLAQAPQAHERWVRTTGSEPSKPVAFASDLALDYADLSLPATMLLPLGKAATAARAVGTRPALLSGLRELGADAVGDGVVETTLAAGLLPPGYYDNKGVKTDEQLSAAKDQRNANELVRLPDAMLRAQNDVRQEATKRIKRFR